MNERKKPGPKSKISKSDLRHIKTEITRSFATNEKCSSMDLKRRLNINASKSTILRRLKAIKYSYQDVKRKFYLNRDMKQRRVEMSKKYIILGTRWEKVIFSDEKMFTLDGCDSYRCWVENGRSPRRIKKVLRSPGLMIWGMTLPNGLLSYEIMRGKQNSANYINILKTKAIPIIQLNYNERMTFQQDNCPIHISKQTKKFFKETNLDILEWPAYSPDLNIIENIWQILSQYVYDGFQIKNLRELEIRIMQAVESFNENKTHIVENLYKSMPHRLISIISGRGDRIKY